MTRQKAMWFRARTRAGTEVATAWSAAAAIVALLVGLLTPLPAEAGGVGDWTNVTGATGTVLTQADAGRRPDGTLAVAWVRQTPGSSTEDVMFRTLGKSGGNQALQVLQSGWSGLGNPAYLVSNDLALEGVFMPGIRSVAPGDPHTGLSFTANPFAVPPLWTLGGAVIDHAASGSNAWASDVEAVATAGTFGYYFTWSGSNGVWVHFTTLSGVPDQRHDVGIGSFGYHSSLGYDPVAGDLWVAFASNSTSDPGLWVSQVDQGSGAPTGLRYRLPKSATLWNGSLRFDMMLAKVPTTGRPKHKGVFVAYPTGYPTPRRVRLWKVMPASGDRRVLTVAAGGAEKRQAALAAQADGRVWVVWSERDGARTRVFVRRSNASVTSFGPTASIRTPKGYGEVWVLAAVARNGRLDVLAHASGGKQPATLHVQFKPPA